MKEQHGAYTVRLPLKTIALLKTLENQSKAVNGMVEAYYPDLLNPPAIETAAFEYGYMAFEDGYCGCGDCDSILGIGKTKEIAKEDFLDKWREQQ